MSGPHPRKMSTEQARSTLESYFAGSGAQAKTTLASQWKDGVRAFENGDYDIAINIFSAGTQAKMLYNLGIIYTKTQAYGNAINVFSRAIESDRFFAVCHFQRALCFFMNKDYQKAIADYKISLHLLRDNDSIDYAKLGLSGVKLHRTEILFNLVIVEKRLGNEEAAKEMLKSAQKIDATRYSIKTDFISLERQLFVAKETDVSPLSVGYALFAPPRSAQDVGNSLIGTTTSLAPSGPSFVLLKDEGDPKIKLLRKAIEARPAEEKDRIYYMLTVLSKYAKDSNNSSSSSNNNNSNNNSSSSSNNNHNNNNSNNNNNNKTPGNENPDISGKEEEIATHVNEMARLFFDSDVKVMLDRQAKEFEKVPEKRMAIWRTWCQLLEEQVDDLEVAGGGPNTQNFLYVLLNSKALLAAVKSVCTTRITETEEGYIRQIFNYVFKSSVDSDDLLYLVAVVSNSCSKNIPLIQPMSRLLLDFKHVKQPSEKDHHHIFPSNLHTFQLIHRNCPSLQVLHTAVADTAPLVEQAQSLCATSSKDIEKYEEEQATSQVTYTKSLNAVEIAIQETVTKLEKLRTEIKDIQGRITTRNAEMTRLQEEIGGLEANRSDYITLSNNREVALQSERAANEDRISKYTKSGSTIQVFSRKMKYTIFKEKNNCLKNLESLLKEEEKTIAVLETKLASYKSSTAILDSEPDILARLETAFAKYKATYKISTQHTSSMTIALNAYEQVAKKEYVQSTGLSKRSPSRRSIVLDVYELMATDKADAISARSASQQVADDVVARELKKRLLVLVEKQKYLVQTYKNLEGV